MYRCVTGADGRRYVFDVSSGRRVPNSMLPKAHSCRDNRSARTGCRSLSPDMCGGTPECQIWHPHPYTTRCRRAPGRTLAWPDETEPEMRPADAMTTADRPDDATWTEADDAAALRYERDELLNDMAGLEAEMTAAKEARDKAEVECQQRIADAVRAVEQVAATGSDEVAALRYELGVLQQDNANAMDALRNELNVLQQDRANAMGEVGALRDELELLRQDKADALGTVDALRHELDLVQQDKANALGEVNALRKDLDALTQNMTGLEAECEQKIVDALRAAEQVVIAARADGPTGGAGATECDALIRAEREKAKHELEEYKAQTRADFLTLSLQIQNAKRMVDDSEAAMAEERAQAEQTIAEERARAEEAVAAQQAERALAEEALDRERARAEQAMVQANLAEQRAQQAEQRAHQAEQRAHQAEQQVNQAGVEQAEHRRAEEAEQQAEEAQRRAEEEAQRRAEEAQRRAEEAERRAREAEDARVQESARAEAAIKDANAQRDLIAATNTLNITLYDMNLRTLEQAKEARQQAKEAEQRAEEAEQRAEKAEQRAEETKRRAEQAEKQLTDEIARHAIPGDDALKQLRAEHADAVKRVQENVREELERLRANLKAEHETSLKAKEAELAAEHSLTISALQAALDSLTDEMNGLKKENAELLEVNAELAQENDTLADKTRRESQVEADDLKNAQLQFEKLAKENEASLKQAHAAEQRVTELQAENDRLEQRQAQLQTQSAELVKKEAELKLELANAAERAAEDAKALGDCEQTHELLAQELAQLKAELKSSEREKHDAYAAFDEETKAHDKRMQNVRAEFERDMRTLEKQFQTQKKQTHIEELDRMNHEHAAAMKQLKDSCDEELGRMAKEREQIVKEHEVTLEQIAEHMGSTLANKATQFTELQAANDALDRAVQEAKAAAEESARGVAQCKEKLSECQRKLDECTGELKKCHENSTMCAEENVTAKAAAAECKRKLKICHEKSRKFSEENAKIKDECSKENARIKADLEARDKENAKIKAENARIKADLDARDKENAKIKADLDACNKLRIACERDIKVTASRRDLAKCEKTLETLEKAQAPAPGKSRRNSTAKAAEAADAAEPADAARPAKIQAATSAVALRYVEKALEDTEITTINAAQKTICNTLIPLENANKYPGVTVSKWYDDTLPGEMKLVAFAIHRPFNVMKFAEDKAMKRNLWPGRSNNVRLGSIAAFGNFSLGLVCQVLAMCVLKMNTSDTSAKSHYESKADSTILQEVFAKLRELYSEAKQKGKYVGVLMEETPDHLEFLGFTVTPVGDANRVVLVPETPSGPRKKSEKGEEFTFYDIPPTYDKTKWGYIRW